jgi:hypothetical protein
MSRSHASSTRFFSKKVKKKKRDRALEKLGEKSPTATSSIGGGCGERESDHSIPLNVFRGRRILHSGRGARTYDRAVIHGFLFFLFRPSSSSSYSSRSLSSSSSSCPPSGGAPLRIPDTRKLLRRIRATRGTVRLFYAGPVPPERPFLSWQGCPFPSSGQGVSVDPHTGTLPRTGARSLTPPAAAPESLPEYGRAPTAPSPVAKSPKGAPRFLTYEGERDAADNLKECT